MLRSASRSAAQQGGPPAEPQPPERQKEALKVMGKLRATNHSGKRGAGCAHSTKDLEQDEEPSSAQQRAAKKKVRTSSVCVTSSKRYKGESMHVYVCMYLFVLVSAAPLARPRRQLSADAIPPSASCLRSALRGWHGWWRRARAL